MGANWASGSRKMKKNTFGKNCYVAQKNFNHRFYCKVGHGKIPQNKSASKNFSDQKPVLAMAFGIEIMGYVELKNQLESGKNRIDHVTKPKTCGRLQPVSSP